MKAWVFPCVAALLAGLAGPGIKPAPRPWARRKTPCFGRPTSGQVARCALGRRGRCSARVPRLKWIGSGPCGDTEIPAFGCGPKAMARGWLQGAPEALDAWVEDPGTMAAHWREEHGFNVSLVRTNEGWVWRGSGTVVWRESGSIAGGGEVWLTSSLPEPWWAGPRGWAPWSEAGTHPRRTAPGCGDSRNRGPPAGKRTLRVGGSVGLAKRRRQVDH